MDFRRAKYILPNLFTLTSLGAGLYSIHLSTAAQSLDEITLAAWVLLICMVCDGLDGRVARMTRSETELGIQLDSLADAIAFGVAPAFLIYHWGLETWGVAGMLVAFFYVACAVLRLARFNMLATRAIGIGSRRYFTGLPTPLSAGMVISLVLAHVSFTGQATTGAYLSVAAVTLFLGGLMVSNVRYRTFKDINLRAQTLMTVLALVASSVVLSVIYEPSITLVIVMVAYIVLGVGGGILSLSKNLLGFDDDDEPQLAEAGDDLDF